MKIGEKPWEEVFNECGLARHFGPKGCGGMTTRDQKASAIKTSGNGLIIHQEFGHWRDEPKVVYSISLEMVQNFSSSRLLIYESAKSRGLVGTKDHWVK